MRFATHLIVAVAIAAATNGCGEKASEFQRQERAARKALLESAVEVTGRVVDTAGAPISGATVRLSTNSAVTTSDGGFRIEGIPRANELLRVQAPRFRPELIAVAIASHSATVQTGEIVLAPYDGSVARMLFAGDTAFARRMLDPDESTAWTEIPADKSHALVKASDPESGTRAALTFMRPFFQLADWSSLNLETPVTANPATPHPTKDFAFFTLPGSLPALSWAGIDYVSLGNNHVFDYLDGGLRDTILHLRKAGIPYSGAGLTSADAFRAHRTTIAGHRYAYLAATSITGDAHPITYVATATKGGAADATLTREMSAAIAREVAAGFTPIIQIHGGDEYTFEPTFVQKRMRQALNAGAALVIGHHPHVPQGVGRHNGRFSLFSLGNFAFDQDRLETMLSIVARVDMRGSSVEAIRLTPIYLKDFRPRPLTGAPAASLLRRLGEFSRAHGTLVYPHAGQGWVAAGADDAVSVERTVDVQVQVPASGVGILDLRSIARPEESLAGVQPLDAVLSAELGRDLLIFGDFESWDVDDGRFNAPRWDFSGGDSHLCISKPFRGTASACSLRLASSGSDSVTGFRNRVRVMGDPIDRPNKRLSLLAYVAGENAGPVSITSRYYASEGTAQFGEERIGVSRGGTFKWRQVSADLHMPDDVAHAAPLRNARALRLFVRHSPPASGAGRVAIDEMAVISWEAAAGRAIATPHGFDFVRVRAAPGSQRLRLKLRSYVPAAVARARRAG